MVFRSVLLVLAGNILGSSLLANVVALDFMAPKVSSSEEPTHSRLHSASSPIHTHGSSSAADQEHIVLCGDGNEGHCDQQKLGSEPRDCGSLSAASMNELNATEYIASGLCSARIIEGADSASDPNMTVIYTDDHGKETDWQGFVDAYERMEKGIKEYGELRYYISRSTGIKPNELKFDEADQKTTEQSYATAKPGTTSCTGDDIADVVMTNKCFKATNAASILYHGMPSNCLLTVWKSSNCEGSGTIAVSHESKLGCFTGLTYNSIRADCASA